MQKAHAGHVHMAYNEFIQQMVEGGLLGLLFPVCILLCLLIPPLADKDRFTGMSGAAYAGMIAFALMSMVNFTVQAVPVMCLSALYAAMYTVTPGGGCPKLEGKSLPGKIAVRGYGYGAAGSARG